MKFFIFLILVLNFGAAFAQEFKGCGEYSLKGVVRKVPGTKLGVAYIVHEKTKSQLQFEFNEKDDFVVLVAYLDKPTSLNAKVFQNMDGTKGEMQDVSKIALRFPNPLSPNDTEFLKLKDLDCKKK
jgi:hypothetical protein